MKQNCSTEGCHKRYYSETVEANLDGTSFSQEEGNSKQGAASLMPDRLPLLTRLAIKERGTRNGESERNGNPSTMRGFEAIISLHPHDDDIEGSHLIETNRGMLQLVCHRVEVVAAWIKQRKVVLRNRLNHA